MFISRAENVKNVSSMDLMDFKDLRLALENRRISSAYMRDNL